MKQQCRIQNQRRSFPESPELWVKYKKYCNLIQFQKEIDFSCAVDTHLSVDVGINVNVDFILVDIEQDIGAFDVEMAVYNSSDFAIPVE